jgi:hypothetical protein
MDGAPAPDALRELVREVLRDALPALTGQNGSQPPASDAPPAQAMPASAPPRPPVASSGLPAGARRPPAVPPTPPTSDPAPSSPPTSDPPPSAPAGVERVPGAARLPEAFGGPGAAAYQTASEPGLTLQPVRLVTDEDLREFALQIVRLADNPKRRRDLLAGRLRFTLAAAGFSAAPAGLVPHAGTGHAGHRIERGAVTERAVQAAATAGARLVLGPRAVLTPLARDRARALGVPIEKER